jgi:hypothetical protein
MARSRSIKPEPLMRKFSPLISLLSGPVAASAASAENWPSRLIKATIPFGAGSATEVVPRLVFDRQNSASRS